MGRCQGTERKLVVVRGCAEGGVGSGYLVWGGTFFSGLNANAINATV